MSNISRMGKGKARESLDSLIDEAMSSPLPRPAQFEPISPPPRAHYPSTMANLGRPRLVSQLARSTLPTASLTYDKPGESSRRKITDFPDLDPDTGLPEPDPTLHLQRTITGLLETPPPSAGISSYLPAMKLPDMSSLQILPRRSLDSKRTDTRQISTSAPKEDWGTWASGWLGGKKKDSMLSEEDQADTAEEEQENLQRKCEYTFAWLIDRTPKYPLVFCHGLLGFDYIGPTSLPPLQISHWRGIREVLESNGVEVLITRVPATASIADRAAILDEVISEKYEGRKINLIGHSMVSLALHS